MTQIQAEYREVESDKTIEIYTKQIPKGREDSKWVRGVCVFGTGGKENEEGTEKHFRQRKHLNTPIFLGHSEPEMREIP